MRRHEERDATVTSRPRLCRTDIKFGDFEAI
jgi:hypothetical protein